MTNQQNLTEDISTSIAFAIKVLKVDLLKCALFFHLTFELIVVEQKKLVFK